MFISTYRAWDKLSETMTEVMTIDYLGTEGIISKVYLWNRKSESFYWRKFSEVVLEQFFGIYDKNGEKIHEGDLFKFDDSDDFKYAYIGFDVPMSVYRFYVYDNGEFKDYPNDELALFDFHKMEIIGNIHEGIK